MAAVWQPTYHGVNSAVVKYFIGKQTFQPNYPFFDKQKCNNTAVRLVYGLCSHNYVSAAMTKLHWLPVEARIQFKLCLPVHLTLIGKAPTYITDVLQPVLTLSSRLTVLHSATRSDFLVPRMCLKFGERAFSVAAPKAWNNLPTHVRAAENTNDTFKRRVKTFYSVNFMILLTQVILCKFLSYKLSDCSAPL